MKKISSWLLLLLLAGEVPAQLQVVTDPHPQAVFGGVDQKLNVQFRNVGGQALESDLRLVLLQTSSATVVQTGEWPWKKLMVLPGQQVLESVRLDFPSVRAETRFLLQWVAGRSNVIGQMEVLVQPTNLLAQLKVLAGGEPLGMFDPANVLKPLLRTQAVEFVDLVHTGTDMFQGKLAIFGPFDSHSCLRASLSHDIRALAKRGVAVVWLLPPPTDQSAPFKPSFYRVPAGEGGVVVAAHDLVAGLAEQPEAQLNLLRLAAEALYPGPWDLPETANSN